MEKGVYSFENRYGLEPFLTPCFFLLWLITFSHSFRKQGIRLGVNGRHIHFGQKEQRTERNRKTACCRTMGQGWKRWTDCFLLDFLWFCAYMSSNSNSRLLHEGRNHNLRCLAPWRFCLLLPWMSNFHLQNACCLGFSPHSQLASTYRELAYHNRVFEIWLFLLCTNREREWYERIVFFCRGVDKRKERSIGKINPPQELSTSLSFHCPFRKSRVWCSFLMFSWRRPCSW